MKWSKTMIVLLTMGLASPAVMAEGTAYKQTRTEDTADELQNAKETVSEAGSVIEQLRKDPESDQYLRKAEAVFIVPDYGRASLGVGAAGGQGVLMVNNDGKWSGPGFYNIGSVNVGLAAGAEAGSIAFLIMQENAMEGFREDNNFSLNADAGLTILDWSERGQASAGKGADVIVWSDTEGLYGDVAISVANIFWDEEANRVYYQRDVAVSDFTRGQVPTPMSDTTSESEFSALEIEDPDK